MATRADKVIEPHLAQGEEVVASLRGLIRGYTRWTTVGSGTALVVTLTVISIFDLNLFASLALLLAAILASFMLTLNFVGRPLAARHDPALATPYVALALTDRRVLLVEQSTGRDTGALVEDVLRSQISHVDFAKGGWMRPQRLSYRARGEERELEFPRMEPVFRFVEALQT